MQWSPPYFYVGLFDQEEGRISEQDYVDAKDRIRRTIMVLASDEVPLSVLVGQQEQNASAISALTDTMVSGSTTIPIMEASVLAAPLHADQQPNQNMANSGLTIGGYTGDVPSNPSTTSPATVAGLIARTQLDISQRPSQGPAILD